MEDACSSPTCSQSGTRQCSGCKSATYCSTSCQKDHWPTHKQQCPAAQKYNCYLIRASPSVDTVSDRVEHLHLQAFGNEFAETQELQNRLGWRTAVEVGKFYDHLGTDTWYYYVYGLSSKQATGLPRNAIASAACGKSIFGDVALVRSGPVGANVPETFSKAVLVKALEYYKTKDSNKVFAEREKNRASRAFGMDLSGVPSMHVDKYP